MASPKNTVSFWAPVAGADVAVAVRDLVLPDSNGRGNWVVATEENRGTRRTEAIALSATSGAGFGPFELQHTGTIDAETSGLPTAPGRSLVRCSSTGRMERVATEDVDPDVDDVIGYAEPDGRVHLYFGFPFAELAVFGGGGATPGGSVGDAMVHGTGGTLVPMRDADGNTPAVGAVGRWDGTKWVARDDVVELPDSIARGDFLYSDGSDLARLAPPAADGTYGVVWSGGIPTGWAETGGGGGSFAWPTLAWTSLYMAPYDDAAAWASTASAGTSGTAASLDSAARPSEGTAVNGIVPAVFNGSTQFFASGDEPRLSVSAYSIVALVKLNAYGSGGGAGTEYAWPFIIGDQGGNWGLFVDASGVGLYHNDPEGGTKAVRSNLALNTWALIVGTYDSTNIALSINAVAGTPLAAVDLNPAHAAGSIFVGKSATDNKASISLLRAGTFDFALSSGQQTNLKAGANADLGLSL